MHRVRQLHAHVAASSLESPRRPAAVILGAGAGIGQGVARRFAAEGFHVVLVRRGSGPDRLLKESDDAIGKLEAFARSLRDAGGEATAMFADCTLPEQVADVMRRVEATIGPIQFLNYNVGAQVGDRSLEQTSYRIFELALRLGASGAFAAAKEAARYMVPRGQGTIIFTSATAAMRGKAGQHAHAAAMAARRMLSQSLAAELGPKGIHVVHVNIDGLVNAPETVGGFINRAAGSDSAFDQVVRRLQGTQEIVEPAAVADTYFHLHSQPRGVWTQELDLKPWTTKAWFSNSESNATSVMRKAPDQT